MWVRSTSLIVLSTDGWFLFRLDTENHSSQLVPQYSTVTPHWPVLQQGKPNHRRGQQRTTFYQGFSSYHSTSSPSGWMRSHLCHVECPPIWSFRSGYRWNGDTISSFRPTLLLTFPGMGCCWHVYLLSHLCLRDNNKTHWLNCSCASSTPSYLTARPIGEVCAAPADTDSPVQSIYVSHHEPPHPPSSNVFAACTKSLVSR